MNNKIKSIILGSIVLASPFVFSACSDDFLDKQPTGKYTAPTFYSSDDAVRKGTEPLYNRAWFNFNRRALIGMGSYRANDGWNPYVSKEFALFQVTALTQDMGLAWSALYTVVTMSNSILHNVEQYATPDVSEAAKNAAIGECYLMRGWAYFYLLRGWGDNILFEDNQDMIDMPIVPLNPESDVLKFIVRDFRKAAEYLPEVGVDHHPSRYAAKAALAKALLAQSGWDAASTIDHDRDASILQEVVSLCNEVINCGQYDLMDNYEDLFKAQNNDNCETVLAMRWADPSSGSWGAMNGLYSDLCFQDVTDVNVWGGNLSASIDMLELYNEDPADSIRRDVTFFTQNEHYDYIKAAEGGYTYTKKWTQLKKGVLGTKADVAPCGLASQASPLNTYFQRLADVYLIKAEALLGNSAETSDPEALEAFNKVRRRAHVGEYSKITFMDILRERRIEFCMEYFTWWDMVSYYRWKPQTMLEYFNYKQYRGWETRDGCVIKKDDGTLSYRAIYPGIGAWYLNTPQGNCIWSDCLRKSNDDNTIVKTIEDGYDFKAARDEALAAKAGNYQPIVLNESNIFMPYPESDVIQNHFLKEDPVPYEFK